MAHTILLMQWDQVPESRVFFEYESPGECINSICRIFEGSVRLTDDDVENLEVYIVQLYEFLDGLKDIVCLVYRKENNSYEPHNTDWIKEQLYKQLVLKEYI